MKRPESRSAKIRPRFLNLLGGFNSTVHSTSPQTCGRRAIGTLASKWAARAPRGSPALVARQGASRSGARAQVQRCRSQ